MIVFTSDNIARPLGASSDNIAAVSMPYCEPSKHRPKSDTVSCSQRRYGGEGGPPVVVSCAWLINEIGVTRSLRPILAPSLVLTTLFCETAHRRLGFAERRHMKTWNRADLREVRPWPTDLHFEDGKQSG
jgi:hypothetical protein